MLVSCLVGVEAVNCEMSIGSIFVLLFPSRHLRADTYPAHLHTHNRENSTYTSPSVSVPLFISFSSRSPFTSHEWTLCQWLQAFLYWTIYCVCPRRYTLALKYTLNQNLLWATNVFNSYISVWLGWSRPLLLYVDFIYVHLIFHRVTLTLSQKHTAQHDQLLLREYKGQMMWSWKAKGYGYI